MARALKDFDFVNIAGDGKRKRVFLDELDPNAGRYEKEKSIGCGVLCDIDLLDNK